MKKKLLAFLAASLVVAALAVCSALLILKKK